MDRKAVTNTSESPNPEWLMGMNPSAIENQEKEGQQEIVNSEVLPAEVYGEDGEGRTKLEQNGVTFGSPVEGDPLFVFCTLPTGWTKRATEHVMWSSLLNADGKVVAEIFYKAAFYDRKAYMRVTEQ